ncbi:hypothetical protein [Flavobacterium sp. XS2P39]|uniref:hypothetical protein n=1 Tax=Flavobacterium sp. XS2P39 TaxID=3401725 RepID=UPI003AAED50C
MKKNVFIAVFAVSGLVFVSCTADTEGLENTTQNQKELVLSQEKDELFSREDDSITVTIPDLPQGPGDDPIVVPPPPKP